MNWQPIETAPKDGTEILASLLYQSDKKYPGVRETFFVYWVTDFEEYPESVWAFDCNTPIKHGTPTHWMPVPRYVEPIEESKEPPQPGTITLSGPGAKRWEEIYSMRPPPTCITCQNYSPRPYGVGWCDRLKSFTPHTETCDDHKLLIIQPTDEP